MAGVFAFFTNNPLFKWIAAFVVGYGIWRANEEIAERRGARRARERSVKRARKVQEKNREYIDEKSAQTARARDTVQPVSGSASVRDDLRGILFGDDGNDSGD